MQPRKLLTLSGVVAVVVLMLAFAVSGDSPGTSADAATVKAFYLDHTTGQQFSAYLLMIAVPFIILFAASARASLIESGDSTRSLWGDTMFAGGAIAGAGFLLTACLSLALAESPKALDGSAIQALNAFSTYTWAAFTVGIAVLMLGAAGGLIPQRSGLRWLGWAGLALAILTFTPAGFVAFAGSGLWVVLTSVALTMRPSTRQASVRERVVMN
jgi:hypothetical protein